MGMKQTRLEQWKKINDNLESEDLSQPEIREAMNTLESLIENTLPKLDENSTKRIKDLRRSLKNWRKGWRQYIRRKKRDKQTISSKKRYMKKKKKEVDTKYLWVLFTELTKHLERQDLLPE